MPDGIHTTGVKELRRRLRTIESKAPAELNRALKSALEPVQFVAQVKAPRGESGELQVSTRLTTKGSELVFRNPKPYAKTIHWGRKQLRGHSSPVKGRPWLWDTLVEQREEILRRTSDEIESFIEGRTF